MAEAQKLKLKVLWLKNVLVRPAGRPEGWQAGGPACWTAIVAGRPAGRLAGWPAGRLASLL